MHYARIDRALEWPINPALPNRQMNKSFASLALFAALALCAPADVFAQICRPIGERTGEAGCWIVSHTVLAELPPAPVFWHLDTYLTRAEAEAAKGPRGTVVQSLANIGIGNLAHARAIFVEHTLHGSFGGQAVLDRLGDARGPAAIFGKHAEGFQNVAMLAAMGQVGIFQHAVQRILNAGQRLAEPHLLGA